LATCAAFVCVEFVDSTAYGTNTVNTYSGQQSQAFTNQGAGANANQVTQATYSYPQTFSAFSVYGGFPAGASTGAAFPFYQATGAQSQNAFAYGNSASNQATTQHNDYFNDNHAWRYVCFLLILCLFYLLLLSPNFAVFRNCLACYSLRSVL
jgi:hypothetical protein